MRWALVAAIFVVACGSVFAAEEKETRQQKIDRLCKGGKWADAEPYATAEAESAISRYTKMKPRDGSFDLAVAAVVSLTKLAEIYNRQQMWDASLMQTQKAEDICSEWEAHLFYEHPSAAQLKRQKGLA